MSLPYNGSTSASDKAFVVTHLGDGSGSTWSAIEGNAPPLGIGVRGVATNGIGVEAVSLTINAVNAYCGPQTSDPTNLCIGVNASTGPLLPYATAVYANSPIGTGVRAVTQGGTAIRATSAAGVAVSASSTQGGVAIRGESPSTGGIGVVGSATGSSGFGVSAWSTQSRALSATTESGSAIFAQATNSGYSTIFASSLANAAAIVGDASGGSGVCPIRNPARGLLNCRRPAEPESVVAGHGDSKGRVRGGESHPG